MREMPARVGKLLLGERRIAPVRVVIEAKCAGIGFAQYISNLRFIRSMPRKRRREKHVDEAVHGSARRIRFVSERVLRANGMMQPGSRFER